MNCRFKPTLFSIAGLLLAGAFSTGAQAQTSTSHIVAGGILVRWQAQSAPLVLAPSTDAAPFQQRIISARLSRSVPGAKLKKVFAASGWSLVSVPAGESTETARARLAALLGTANVSFNYRRHASKTPNDPQYSSQWQWPKIKAPDAWNLTTGSANVVVAVLDTGVDLNHADLKANLWKNPKEIAGNHIDDDKNGYVDDVNGLNAIDPALPPQDENGHGTHCAGLLGAVGNNSTSVTGAAWNVKVMSLKFLDANGDGEDADAIECIEYAVKLKKSGVNLRVISNSWGGPDDNPALKREFQVAEGAGLLSVCAAGNEGYSTDQTPEYPASYPWGTVVSVAASNQNDALPYFSNFGVTSVDLTAPGTSILSLQLGGGTILMDGTSMSTPIVAGAAALLAAREPGLSALALKSRLMKSVDKIPALKTLVASGGRLNMGRAISNAIYAVSGQVYRLTDSGAREPLAGAIVTLGATSTSAARSATTGSDGRYSFTALTPATYSLSAALRGYSFATQSRTLPVAAGTSGAPNALADFAATSVPSVIYTLSGHAQSEDGTPKSGISIFLSDAPAKAAAITDASGNYVIRDRAAGTYKLTALGGGYNWTASPTSISLPTSEGNGIVDFTGTLTDTLAPQITISAPTNGAVLAPGGTLANGIARDASGVTQVFLQLTRESDFTTYNWVSRKWTSDASESGTVLTRPASGTDAAWAATLPGLSAASYSLRAWGRDALGNESHGEADAVTSFSVRSTSSSSALTASSAKSF